jgi:hypothetical protein
MPCHAMPCPAPALTWTDAVGARGYPWVPGELPDAAALLGHRLLCAVDELKVAVEVPFPGRGARCAGSRLRRSHRRVRSRPVRNPRPSSRRLAGAPPLALAPTTRNSVCKAAIGCTVRARRIVSGAASDRSRSRTPVLSAGEVSGTMSRRIGTPNWLGVPVQAPGRRVQALPRG